MSAFLRQRWLELLMAVMIVAPWVSDYGGRWLDGTGRQKRAARSTARTRPPGSDRAGVFRKEERSGFLTELEDARRREEIAPAEARALLRSGTFPAHRMADLVAQWAEEDPRGAFEWVCQQAGDVAGVVADTMTAFYRRDPEGAVEAFRAVKGVAWGGAAMALVREMLFAEPALAAKIESSLNGQEGWRLEHLPLLKTEDKCVALAPGVAALPPGRVRSILLGKLATRWIEEGGVDAWEWSKTLPENDGYVFRAAWVGTAVGENRAKPTPEQLAKAMEWLGEPGSSYLRASWGAQAVGLMAQRDPEGAWAWATQHLRGIALQNAVSQWGHQVAGADPAKARAWVEALPPGSVRSDAIAAVAEDWASRGEPAEVAAWAKELHLPPDHDGWGGIAAAWAKRSPEAFVEAVRQEPQTLPATAWADGFAQIAKESPDRGVAWARSLPPELRDVVYVKVVPEMADGNAARGAALLPDTNVLRDSPETVDLVVQRFHYQNAAAARAWADGLAPGPLKDRAQRLLGAIVGTRSTGE